MAEPDTFFSRWSRRKSAAVQGQALPEPLASPSQAQVQVPVQTVPVAPPSVPSAAPAPSVAPEAGAPVPLTLEDTQVLTPQSDFKPFMARDVAPQVKNAALKKLFADPHYNVMDRLDIYIDDYSLPDPLPASTLRKMASAQFLNLFDEEVPHAPPPASQPALAGEDANTRADPDLPQSELSTADADAQPLNPTDAHAHADLRLQPHDSALDAQVPVAGPAAGPGGP